MLFSSLVSPRMTACGVSDGRKVSFLNLYIIQYHSSQRFSINAVIKDMYESFFQDVTKWTKNSPACSKSFFEKEYVFVFEITQGCGNSC